MFSKECFIKKTKMPMHIIGAFSILVVVGILASNINIEKSFAAEKVALLPLNSDNAELNTDVTQFYKCIKKSVENSETEQEPTYFNDEPTKTEVALCYKEVLTDKK
ncbi:MAG: hypothetical protein H0X03_00550 [Nitrosopumilus sp.]|nr:hypothetical protein [Nitrosopumilus sp.]